MIKGLAGASIWSADQNNLVPFYRDTIGLPIAFEAPAFVVFGDANAPTLGIGTHSEVNGHATDPFRHMVALSSDDLDADYERIKAAGVEFIEPPTQHESLRIATLKDPEGNLVQLFQFEQT